MANIAAEKSVFFPVDVKPEARPQAGAPARPPVVLPSYVTPSQQPVGPVKTGKSRANGLVIGSVIVIVVLAIVLAVLLFIYFTR